MTIHMLPGGPDAIAADVDAMKCLHGCSILAPSQHVARYLAEHLDLRSRCFLPPIFDKNSKRRARFGRSVALFNPCVWKGLPILLALADARPAITFMVKTGWGTTRQDFEALGARPNIVVRGRHFGDASSFYGDASTLLVPSLCNESFGLVVIEAMLHGLPVIASNYGGLIEAKLGIPMLVPIFPLQGTGSIDSVPHSSTRAPTQPLEPWLTALDQLTLDNSHWAYLSACSEQAAKSFAASLNWNDLTSVIAP